MREEREKIIKKIYRIVIRMLLYLRRHCSLMPNILAFRTPHESGFLVFGVSNAKYLAFDTPDENALKACYSAKFVEIMALLQGVLLAQELHLPWVILKSDALVAIQAINDKSMGSSSGHLIQEILQI